MNVGILLVFRAATCIEAVNLALCLVAVAVNRQIDTPAYW
jgi:hypothetical protein